MSYLQKGNHVQYTGVLIDSRNHKGKDARLQAPQGFHQKTKDLSLRFHFLVSIAVFLWRRYSRCILFIHVSLAIPLVLVGGAYYSLTCIRHIQLLCTILRSKIKISLSLIIDGLWRIKSHAWDTIGTCLSFPLKNTCLSIFVECPMASLVEYGESSNAVHVLDPASAAPSAGVLVAGVNAASTVPTHNYVATDNNIVVDTNKKIPNHWYLTRQEAVKAAVPAVVWNAMLLPCITYGKTQHDLQRIKKTRENPEEDIEPYRKFNGPCIGYGILAAIPPRMLPLSSIWLCRVVTDGIVAGILAVRETNRIRGEYDIEPRKNNDPKSIFCPHCTVLRDQLEVSQRENQRGGGVVERQPPLSPPMQELSPHPEVTSPPINKISDEARPKKKGKAAGIVVHASRLLHPTNALNHLKKPLSRIPERRSDATQDSHLTGSPAEAIGIPPLPSPVADSTQADEQLPSRLPTPLPHDLYEADAIPEEPFPQPAISPRKMPMDEIIVRIRTPSPTPSRSRERAVPPARANSPVLGFQPHNLSSLRNGSPVSGCIGPALLPHEAHTGAANALLVNDPLSRKHHHRAHSPHSPHRLYNDWVQESEVSPSLGPGSPNLEIDISFSTNVLPLANHVREDQALGGRGRSRSPPEMIVEVPPGMSEPEIPKTGDVRQTPKFVPAHEGHKPTIVDINRRTSPPLSSPLPGPENTGVVGAPPSTCSRRPDANSHAVDEEARGPIGLPKTVTAPNLGAGSNRLGYSRVFLGRSQSTWDGAGSQPNTPLPCQTPVCVTQHRQFKNGRRTAWDLTSSYKGSPAWARPTVVEHAKRMGSYQVMMRDDGTGRLSGLEI